MRHRLCRHGCFNRCCHRCGRLLGRGNSDRCRGFCGVRCKVAATWCFVLHHLGCWRSDCVVLRCHVCVGVGALAWSTFATLASVAAVTAVAAATQKAAAMLR